MVVIVAARHALLLQFNFLWPRFLRNRNEYQVEHPTSMTMTVRAMVMIIPGSYVIQFQLIGGMMSGHAVVIIHRLYALI